MTHAVTAFSLKDAPALIERLLPVQKLSIESFVEQMAGQGKFLVSLGGYWKGRKPLILNKACILGCLLPATEEVAKDLEIFEKLMAMDILSLEYRLEKKNDKESRFILSEHRTVGYQAPYREWVRASCRPEECDSGLFDHIWDEVNSYLGTSAYSFPELVEQLGIMRFGHRPRVADTFCGSGQIPFEAARLGCDVYASDLNPVACMLTWGAFNIVGSSEEIRKQLAQDKQRLVEKVQAEMTKLGVETDGNGWQAKAFLYCVETRCPQSGWLVPLLPSLVISTLYKVVAKLVPDFINKRYDIYICSEVSAAEMQAAQVGTVGRDGKYGEAFLIHQVDGVTYKTKLSTLRGDYQKPDGTIDNQLRKWGKHDFMPHSNDLLQERLYCVQWMRPKKKSKKNEYEFRSVTEADLQRERLVQDYVAQHLSNWQAEGWIPNMQIEVGGPPRYQGLDLIRARGWQYWHHLFSPRQLLVSGLVNRFSDVWLKFAQAKLINQNSRLSRWDVTGGGGGKTQGVFDNQALNTLFNFGCRSSNYSAHLLKQNYKHHELRYQRVISNHTADKIACSNDIYITDPPYGDAVKYEEILDFFIAWLRKNPPPEFADWIWDSRRSLAIKGEDENFRRDMVAAYKQMTECMPNNGIQVIMFTHQSGAIWADMANIVWASGLQVTAAWYVVTETDSALRDGSHVKGTVLLVCRKQSGNYKTTRDDLAWEIQEEVEAQVEELTGLNQQAKGLYRDENVFEDADIQMAGFAASLRVLTRYSIIDGREMAAEAIRPRIKGEITFVDSLIAFAVDTANQCLVPQGIIKSHWDRLKGAERFYLKMLDMEARGTKKLDNYQNFAKVFKVRNFRVLMGELRANKARLRSAKEFGRAEMGEGAELYQSVLRSVLYAIMELATDVDSDAVLAHLSLNIPNYYSDMTQRQLAAELADYLAKRLDSIRPEEASAARVLCELIRNQRLG